MDNRIKIYLNASNIKSFISVTNKYESDIDVISNRVVLDAKSILGLYSLDLSQDIYVQIISDDVTEKRNFAADMEVFRHA